MLHDARLTRVDRAKIISKEKMRWQFLKNPSYTHTRRQTQNKIKGSAFQKIDA